MKLLNFFKKRPAVCVLAVVVVLLFVFLPDRPSGDSPESPGDVSPADTASEAFSSAAEVPEEPAVNAYFESDDLVNDFFEKYNAASAAPIDASEIEKGNIVTKALVYTDLFSMEVINSTRGFLSVSISADPENEDTALKNVFFGCLKAMDESLGDEDISDAWEAIHESGYMVEGHDLDGITISYIPYAELSRGHSELRVDFTFPVG